MDPEGQEGQKQNEGISKLLKIGMSQDAYQRLMNVKAADPKIYEASLKYIVYYIQKGQRIDEGSLQKILATVSSSLRKEMNIKFLHK
jgi:DNA-binding TFAR19-related protein (PDSD5 family)